MPFYSEGVFHTSFTCASGTRQEIVTGIETALSGNGWTVVSGSGTGDVVLQSATPSGGSAVRLRAYDDGVATCTRLYILNQSGGNQSQSFFLLPGAGKVYNIWGCQYQAFVFTSNAGTTSREYFGCGALYEPNWLRTTCTEALWAQGNGLADTNVTVSPCWRNGLTSSTRGGSATGNVMYSTIMNGSLVNRVASNGALTIGELCLAAAGPGYCAATPARRFADNTAYQIDAWVACGQTASTDEPKYRGSLWDAAVVSESFGGGTAKTIDGHTFYALTDSAAVAPGAGQCVGSLFLL